MSLRTATAIINRQALADNYQVIKQLAPNSKVLAILKANAYGHGLERIASALPYADAFGVARIEEALALRACGIVAPIVLLEGFFAPEDLPILAVNDLQTIVHNQQQLDTICQAELAKPLKVWLKIDTGMHRLGINPEQFAAFYQALTASHNVAQELVLMSHFASADELHNQQTEQQIALFTELTKAQHEQKSLANSAAICAWPSSHFDWVRPGLMLYGVSPMLGAHQANAAHYGLAPVMTMQSSLIAMRDIAANEAVGYGAAWRSAKATKIGVIAIGYGDGYPRHAINGTPVLLNGRYVPLVGRVSMDMITVDLGEQAQDKLGDLVILWGEGLPIEKIADCAGTIPYELLCNITRRVKVNVLDQVSSGQASVS
jgi:alanine racemase